MECIVPEVDNNNKLLMLLLANTLHEHVTQLDMHK